MSITISLSNQELADLKQITQLDDDSEAVSKAVREFLRLSYLRQLKTISGKVEFDENWRDLEALELRESVFPQ